MASPAAAALPFGRFGLPPPPENGLRALPRAAYTRASSFPPRCLYPTHKQHGPLNSGPNAYLPMNTQPLTSLHVRAGFSITLTHTTKCHDPIRQCVSHLIVCDPT